MTIQHIKTATIWIFSGMALGGFAIAQWGRSDPTAARFAGIAWIALSAIIAGVLLIVKFRNLDKW